MDIQEVGKSSKVKTKKYLFLLIYSLIINYANAETLKVDFNGTAAEWASTISETEDGFQSYSGIHEHPDTMGMQTYSAFDATISVSPSWASGASDSVMQLLSREDLYTYSTNTVDMPNLVYDWIGTDIRQVGDPLTLTISGLPAGTYNWLSYHHDMKDQRATFNVTVNDANGSFTSDEISISNTRDQGVNSLEAVSKYETVVVSDGINPISLIFHNTFPSADYYTMFVMNGFEISDGEEPWQSDAPLRRPISPEQPMWLVHIDTWNYADPQKIIDLIPMDIRPYVVMNISLSISHDEETSQFQVAEYGYEIAKSWLRTCAQNRMWAMVQPSSGGYSQFSDYDLSVYEEFFREYPNMIGFNYCEQFWGYDSWSDPLSAPWTDRIEHFANLLELSNRYGGYLVVSWCGNQWSPSINPIAMLKRIASFESASRQYPENYILLEKYTQQSYISDMESICLGAYLSGYSGQYGIRYDDTGWTDANGDHGNFTMATGGAPHLEHIMLTGMTVVDAPELIWTQCFREINSGSAGSGYTMRRWGTFPQFDNVSVDIFRKIIDGTVRIPSRQEVIDRTKFVVINDVNGGSNDDKYSSPETLFEGLYRMDGDGNYENNKTFFKKTGRYPTIPTAYKLNSNDPLANSFQNKVYRSGYSSRWPTISSKVSEFNSLFPEEYTGDIYAGRHENAWVVYNPYKTNQIATGSIPFKYNTCEGIDLSFSQYTSGIIKEYSDYVAIYLQNYDNVLDTGLKTDTITIHGSSSEPTYSWHDRASHQSSSVTKSWSNGVFVLTVRHNGPLDITINCSGTASERLTEYTPAVLATPARPLSYTGPLQYEGECFDYKYISGIVKGGNNSPVRNYTGQGYLRFGTNSSAAVRDNVRVLESGVYRLETRYAVTGSDINSIDLYVNGTLVTTPIFTQTPALSDWNVNVQYVNLNSGTNTIEFRARNYGAELIYFDNIVVAPTEYSGNGIVIQENRVGFASVDGIVGTAYSGYTGDGYLDTEDVLNAGVNWEIDFDTSITRSFTFFYACPEDRTADLLVNGNTIVADIEFPATSSWSDWNFVTVYARASSGVSSVRLESNSISGLPNLDYIEVTGIYALEAPDVPIGLAASALPFTGQIDLSWEASFGATSYNVKYSTEDSGPYITLGNTTETNFTDSGLPELTTYYYVVSAVNSAGESIDSSQVNATTSNYIAPDAPLSLIVTAETGQISLSWEENLESDFASYNVYRSMTSGNYTTIIAEELETNSFVDSNVFNSTTYYYVITAVDSAGNESEFSNAASETVTDGGIVLLNGIDFESGFGDWMNIIANDTHDWTLNSGETTTPTTGPLAGADGSTWYAYLETSPGGANKAGNTAIIESPEISGVKRSLSFDFHMYGIETGSLYVDVFDEVWHNSVWSISGQQQTSSDDAYTSAIVNLFDYTGLIKLRIRAVASGGSRGDIAIDNIVVTGDSLYGDFDGDNVVDISDLASFAGYWLQENLELDLNGNDIVDIFEFSELSGNWNE